MSYVYSKFECEVESMRPGITPRAVLWPIVQLTI